ncbi:ABC transporter permease [Zobellia galactanivorans]|uniref:ABC transporter, permease component n=1 Tax=Zobellia galactanivorans (strain DSM 12802 / CCUG 47099 / CIP 106680 / NCIMB 13871 / Dsij) TaxID=63186 RepID=G0L3M2_ZOBGA|nr:ABC transporter permease [Zobellia galactanivorans]CAZ98508.1 ABC transporter, permease component [Zobellia galactanivorans]
MNNWIISLKNISHKPLYAFLSVFSLSISIGLLLGIQQLDTSIQNQFENGIGNVEMVVGAKGSPLQLVLSSVLHIDNPTGNIPYYEVEKMAKNPLVKDAVPISYGDNYKSYRIVGSTLGFAKMYGAELFEGREVKNSMETVLGHEVAQQLGLKLGDTFVSSHGLTENSIEQHDESFIVVGIYKPTYKVIDRLIITELASIWHVHHHSEEHDKNEEVHKEHDHDEEHDLHEADEREVTSMLVTFRNPMGYMTMPRNINANTDMQAAMPKYELERLFRYTAIGVKAISWIAYIILLISSISIFIGLYKMVRERSFDLALMRTYGASNFQLFRIVGFEGILMILASLFFGFLLSQIGLHFMVNVFKSQFQQDIILTFSTNQILQTLLIVIAISVVSIVLAILPLLKMNISKILSDEK